MTWYRIHYGLKEKGVTQLKALGGLRLESTWLKSTQFTQPKPLVLLSYLSLEGSQQRKHLAELFWPDGHRMKSLSMTLTRLRQGVGEVVEADEKHAKALLSCDAKELLESLDKSNWQQANELYTGAFLEGVVLEDWSSELEEWVYTTREYLAERVQYALLNLAEDAAKQQDFDKARAFAERAYKLPGLGGTEITNLKRLYPLLSASSSLLAPEVRKELDGYGIAVQLSREEAKAKFQGDKTASQLPTRQTSFVGRDVELTELATLLAKVQLLTLLGTGGVGKTRLALQLALEQQKLGAFEGVYFVSLESLGSPDLILPTILSTLGLTQQSKTQPLSQLIDFIAGRSVLLVLDNLEHLVENVNMLSDLLQQCPNLKLLVTSRERLNLEEEHLFPLEGLAFPTFNATLENATLEETKNFDAVALFSQRAQQLYPQFELKEQVGAVLRICKLVEGLPLGLELAAGWVRLMPCSEIANEIERGLEFLATTTRNVPERHRSLKAAFEYSWQLLTQKEQEVLRKLSVFVGGFRREVASEVAGATIPLLASLVDKSLLRVLPNGRYDQHPLLYQYGQEKLLENPREHDEAKRKHTDYYVHLLKEQAKFFKGPEEKDAVNFLAGDIQNLEVAWKHLIDYGDVRALQEVIQPLSELCASLGNYREGLTFFESATATLDALHSGHQFTLGNLYIAKARFLYFLAQFEQAILVGEEGLSLIQSSAQRDTNVIVRGLNEVARNLSSLAQYGKAISYYEQAIELLKESEDFHRMADLQGNLVISLTMLGEYGKAETIAYEVKAVYERVEDWEGVIWTLTTLGHIKRFTQNYQEYQRLLEEALELYQQKQLTSSWLLCDLLSSLGSANRYLKQYTLATHYQHKALEVARETENLFKLPSILLGLAYSATGLGNFNQAKNYFRECLFIFTSSKEQVTLFNALIGWSKNETALGNDQEAATLLGFVQAQSNLDEEDKREAEEALEGLQGKLAARALEALLEQGKKMTLEQVLELVLHSSDATETVKA
jgi:predicted ATPase